MIKVSYMVRDLDRYNGYMEKHEKQFLNMEQVFNFIKFVRLKQHVEGRAVIGSPMVENSWYKYIMNYDMTSNTSFIIVPEYSVRSACEYMAQYMNDVDNSFTLVLGRVEAFKNAEMTPLILMDPTNYNVYVVAAETYNKKLH